MQIPSYQISNVIKVYSKQLSQSRVAKRQEGLGGAQEKPVDKIRISPEGKKQTIIDKVSDEVFSRLTKYSSQKVNEQDSSSRRKKEIEREQAESSEIENKFVFNFIGEDSKKVTSELSVEGSKFLSDKLEKLVKDTIDK